MLRGSSMLLKPLNALSNQTIVRSSVDIISQAYNPRTYHDAPRRLGMKRIHRKRLNVTNATINLERTKSGLQPHKKKKWS